MIKNLYKFIEQIKKDYQESTFSKYKDFIKDFENGEFNIYPLEKDNGFMVFGNEKFPADLRDIKKYKYDNKAFKHRYYAYYDKRKNKSDKSKVITFILFNPSFANPKTNDYTVNNCLRLAKKEGYNAIEIINLFSYRSTVVKSECASDNTTNIKFIRELLTNKKNTSIVLAWGFGKKEKSFCKNVIQEIEDSLTKIDKSCALLRISVKQKIINTFSQSDKVLHPANSTWSVFGGFEKAAEFAPYQTM